MESQSSSTLEGPSDAPPLVVDLDGTLTPTDTLVESLLLLAKSDFRAFVGMWRHLAGGRAAFKARIAARVTPSGERLPYREEFIAYLRGQRQTGRRLILATAADRLIAERVSEHLGVFDAVIASDGAENIKGKRKLDRIRSMVGDRFSYAGDSQADLPIWRAAASAILVAVPERIATKVRGITHVEQEFRGQRASLATWLRAVRLHQWVKNLLVFVPLLTSFSFLHAQSLQESIRAFVAFGLAASATYLLNDLLDIESDRAHPRKRTRPFAAGLISIGWGMLAIGALLVASAALAWPARGVQFGIAGYVLLTTTYSWVLKRYVLLDVLALSMLYTLRVVVGSLAVDAPMSSWLMAFCAFIFFSLALVKRCAELVMILDHGTKHVRGRDYQTRDLAVLWPLGVGSAVSAVVVFGLFLNSPETRQRYDVPELLWIAAAGLMYWLARMWLKTSRGEMHDDPIVFALRDRGSQITLAAMACATLLARFG